MDNDAISDPWKEKNILRGIVVQHGFLCTLKKGDTELLLNSMKEKKDALIAFNAISSSRFEECLNDVKNHLEKLTADKT